MRRGSVPRRTARGADRRGHDRHVAQGGDWGAGVAAQLGTVRSRGLPAIHFNTLFFAAERETEGDPAPDEREAMDREHYFSKIATTGTPRCGALVCERSAMAWRTPRPCMPPTRTRSRTPGRTIKGTSSESRRWTRCATTSCCIGRRTRGPRQAGSPGKAATTRPCRSGCQSASASPPRPRSTRLDHGRSPTPATSYTGRPGPGWPLRRV